MTIQKRSPFTPDPWVGLQKFTEARIGLGRCGSSLPLKESLKFKLAHAKARDAVHKPADFQHLANELLSAGFKTLLLSSSVTDRVEYLTRPDKGRCLSHDSKTTLESHPAKYDISLIICDGLSAPAIHQSALGVACGFLENLSAKNLTTAPICLVKNGRVAIGDEIGSVLGARISVVLIGERPGLSSPNSLGVYITYNPSPGTTDESRNCISNIRPKGLSVEDGVNKINYLVETALQLKKTGIELKDNMSFNNQDTIES